MPISRRAELRSEDVPAGDDRCLDVPALPEGEYRAIFEATSDGLVINDLETGVVLEANPAMCRMHGYERMTGMHPSEFIHPNSHYLFAEFVETVRRGDDFRCRAQDVRRDGSVLEVEVLGRGLTFQGRPAILGVVRDATDQAQMYHLLEERVTERSREIERRREVAEGLRELLALVNSARSLDEILQNIVNQGRRLLGSDGCAIYVPEEDDPNLLAVRAANGLSHEYIDRKLPVGKMATGLAFQTRWAVANTDVTPLEPQDRDLNRGLELEERSSYVRIVYLPVSMMPIEHPREPLFGAYAAGYRALLAVPLVVKDETYGTLTLYYREPHEFTDEEVELASAFANQAALAIENAQLYSREERRRSELEALYDADEALHRSLRVEDVLKALVQVATNILAANYAAVAIWDKRGERVVAGSATDEVLVGPLPPEDTLLLRTSLTSGTVVIEDARVDPRVPSTFRALTQQAGLSSALMAPIRIDGQIIGMFGASYAQSRVFGTEEHRLLTALGQRAALAIENAWLFSQSEERAAEIERRRVVAEGLRDLLAVVNSGRSLDEILDYVASQASRVLGSDASAIYLPQQSAGEEYFRAHAYNGLHPDYAAIHIPFDYSATGLAFAKRRPVATGDVVASLDQRDRADGDWELEERGSHTRILHMPRRQQTAGSAWEERLHTMGAYAAGYRSLLAVPMSVQDESYGTLTLYYHESRDFADEEVALATAFADQAALAVENARLREQAQQAATLEERQRLARELHDAVTQTLFSASLIAEVIPDLWRSDPDEAARRLEQLQRLTRGALAEMRSLLVELRPGALTEVPLSILLRQLAEAVAGRTHVEVAVTTEGERERRLPPDVQVTFYRLAQEALNNVAKHSRATHTTLVLSYRPGGVMLRIADNGQGFDPTVIPPGHLGVGIMRERAEAVGAELTIDSAPGQGTRIEIDWDDGEGAKP